MKKPYIFSDEQKAIRSARAMAWNALHKDKAKESMDKWRHVHREAIRIKSRQNYLKDPLRFNTAQKNFMAINPWYHSIMSARARCNNPKNPRYKTYGGRGIKFNLSLDEAKALWLRDNAQALRQPSIDRIDNDGDYTLVNCRWIEKQENSRLGRLAYFKRIGLIKQSI